MRGTAVEVLCFISGVSSVFKALFALFSRRAVVLFIQAFFLFVATVRIYISIHLFADPLEPDQNRILPKRSSPVPNIQTNLLPPNLSNPGLT